MGHVQELYRDFCERMACEFEAEAARYEEDSKLEDRDRQFVSALREMARRMRVEIRRLDANYKVHIKN